MIVSLLNCCIAKTDFCDCDSNNEAMKQLLGIIEEILPYKIPGVIITDLRYYNEFKKQIYKFRGIRFYYKLLSYSSTVL